MPLADDYILRIVREFAQFVARVLRLRTEGKHEDAHEAIRQGYPIYLGVPKDIADALTPASLVEVLGSKERIAAAVQLLDEEAALFRAQGDPWSADERARRAAALRGLGRS